MDPELEAFRRRPAKQLKLQHEAALDETITCLAVVATEEGVIIAAGQSDTPAIVLFDASLAPVRELAGHAGGTNTLVFAGSSRLVSAGEDGSAAVRDPQSGDLLARLECEGENTDK
jgi:WD40 repeat protein